MFGTPPKHYGLSHARLHAILFRNHLQIVGFVSLGKFTVLAEPTYSACSRHHTDVKDNYLSYPFFEILQILLIVNNLKNIVYGHSGSSTNAQFPEDVTVNLTPICVARIRSSYIFTELLKPAACGEFYCANAANFPRLPKPTIFKSSQNRIACKSAWIRNSWERRGPEYLQ